MGDNRLKLNEDKTYLVVISTQQARLRSQSANLVEIRTGNAPIKPIEKQKLLGCWIQDDLKFNNHIRDSEDNLIKLLNQRVNAMKTLSRVTNFQSRKLLANGIFMSKLSYLITIWSNCSKELLNSIQIVQNRAARVVTNRDWREGSQEILKQVGWLSVYQLSFYFKVLQVHQIRINKQPEKLFNMMNWEYTYSTRQAKKGLVKPIGIPKLKISKGSFRWQAAEFYNKLPTELLEIQDVRQFKRNVKVWTRENVSFRA